MSMPQATRSAGLRETLKAAERVQEELADDQAAQTVERARLAAEWAGVALNLEP